MPEETSEQFDAYLSMTSEDIARLILCLLIEEKLRQRLAAFRPDDLPAKPVEGFKELDVVRPDIMPVSDALR
jgi:hypothetical protein